MQMPMTIADVLSQYQRNCSELAGAVVATQDGLVLGASDEFGGDTPAAAAASLWVHLQQDLSLVRPVSLSESLLWADPGVWYLCRLEQNHLLLAYSRFPEHAGALRLAGQIAAQQLARMVTSD
ncbi:hypothetical protein SDC9_159714 [bioreactor metagenome]|uniref:Roadblock/LAMTOR2 domain-containing protein n=1 Tax=bioreactor metagenome TaxID=1076179 RepID=A0A645FFL8_9ZZZZ